MTFFSYTFTHLHIYTRKYDHQVRKYQCIWDQSKKRLEQRTKNGNKREYMLISLGNLGKPFLTWETYIYKHRRL